MALILAGIPALFAVLVLYGWATDNESLKQLFMTTVTMNPTTAVGFILLSLAVVVRRRPGRVATTAAVVLLVLAATIGTLKLFEVASGHQIGVDTHIFRSRLSGHYARPSRIAPNAALCFVFISLALLLTMIQVKRVVAVAQSLAVVTGLIALFAFVGHLYGVEAFYAVPAFHPMAIHTAIAFVLLSTVVIMDAPHLGVVAPISAVGPGGRMSRMLLPAAIVFPVAFGWLRQRGEEAGLYSDRVGIALMVMANVLTLTLLTWWNAKLLLTTDLRRSKAEADLLHLASHDFLTGLPNRSYFMDRVLFRLSHPRRRKEDSFAIIYMDLDGFKQVNDRLGHAAGDQVLRDVAEHLGECCRNSRDVVARLGGDEFAMLIDLVGSDGEVEMVADRILGGMPSQVGSGTHETFVGVSLGIVVADVRHRNPESLLSDADHAMYMAKRNGKGRFSVFPVAATDHLRRQDG